MRVEWLSEARGEFRAFLQYYKTEVGTQYAERFGDKVLNSVEQLSEFPEMGVLKHDSVMGRYGFRALFIDQYVCVYKIEGETVYIYHWLTHERTTCFIFLAWIPNSRDFINNKIYLQMRLFRKEGRILFPI